MSDQRSEQRIDWQLPFGIWAVAAPTLVGSYVAIGVLWSLWAATLLWLTLWLTALLKLIEPTPRAFLAGTLRKSSFTQVYTWLVRPRLDRLWSAVCDTVEDRATLPTTFRAALTWKLYDRALLIAVAYPILLLTGQWAAGWDGKLGDATILPAAPLWPNRAVAIGAIALLFVPLAAERWITPKLDISGWWVPPLRVTLVVIIVVSGAVAAPFIFAVVVAILVAVSVAGARAGAGGVVVAGAYAVAVFVPLLVAGAVVGAFAVAGAVVGAFAVAVASAFAVEYLDTRNCAPLARLLLTLLLPVLWVIAVLALPWDAVGPDRRGIFLFLGVLPLLNALFDVLSYAVTLALMRMGLAARTPFVWGALDFGIALILFLGLGATLTLVIAGMNALGGTTIFDLGSLFDGIETEPDGYWWLYAMLFSTILPTALHFLASLIGLQGIVPRPLRRRAAALIDAAPASPPSAAFAPIALGTIWLVPFLVAGAIGWGLWLVFGDAVETLGAMYFTSLKALAAWIGAL